MTTELTHVLVSLSPTAQTPVRAHSWDAGADLAADLGDAHATLRIPAGGVRLVPTGVTLHLPAGYMAEVRPRSGLALKSRVTVLNSPGTVDAGFRDPVGVILANFSQEPFTVHHGDRVAQLIVQPVATPAFHPVALPEALRRAPAPDDRGAGGYGSTGTTTKETQK